MLDIITVNGPESTVIVAMSHPIRTTSCWTLSAGKRSVAGSVVLNSHRNAVKVVPTATNIGRNCSANVSSVDFSRGARRVAVHRAVVGAERSAGCVSATHPAKRTMMARRRLSAISAVGVWPCLLIVSSMYLWWVVFIRRCPSGTGLDSVDAHMPVGTSQLKSSTRSTFPRLTARVGLTADLGQSALYCVRILLVPVRLEDSPISEPHTYPASTAPAPLHLS